MSETPNYTKKAINNYRNKFDIIQVRFPKGTREKLVNKGNINDYIVQCVLEKLEDNSELKEVKTTPKREPQKPVFDVQELYQKYGQKMNDIMTQIEIKEKYGDEALQKLYKYIQSMNNNV